ncbi:MAG: HDIG domain-containing protein, partial [Chloroflexota bacterium]|nr:HDIG domain-containing protein [Chloroflexota bacterium]
EEGGVASQDILAPYAVSYISEVLTNESKEQAAKTVSDVYTFRDSGVARQQLQYLRAALNFIQTVRGDEYSTPEQKLADLAALEGIRLTPETAQAILEFSDARWQVVRQEVIVVLEQVMRSTIREYELEKARRNVLSLVSLSLPEGEVAIVSEITAAFVAPNSFYNEEQTEIAREQAREEADAVTRSIATGETILRRGEIAEAEDIEALEQVGLLTSTMGEDEQAGVIAVVALSAVLIILFFRAYPDLTHQPKKLILLVSLLIAFLVLGRLATPGHVVIPYLFPIAAYPLIVSVLIDRKTALFTIIPLAMLMTYGLPNALDLTLYYALGGIIGVLALRRSQRVSTYLVAAGFISVAGSSVIVAYRIFTPGTDWQGLVTLVGASIFSGIASAGLTILIEYTLAPLLGLTTTLQLMDLSRPDQPLLQLLLREAPGTYQHTLQMANLVEQAAERLGANSLLARVGSLYHDVGKAKYPQFFIENQIPGQLDTHEDMPPAESAQHIIQHVLNGIELAQEYKIPKRIQDFILEHHGTSLTRYQYTQAINKADGDEYMVDISKFRYPGPKPQSVETALVMLADGSEAYARAKRPENSEDLRSLVKEIVDKRLEAGQLDDTPLTLKDLTTIIDSFTATLKGTYHSRVNYPEVKKNRLATEDVKTIPIAGYAVDSKEEDDAF